MTSNSSLEWRPLIEKCQLAFYQNENEPHFCDGLCQAMVTGDAYVAAWIGLNDCANPKTGHCLRVVAQSGLQVSPGSEFSWPDADTHPIAKVLQAGMPASAHFAENPPDMASLLPQQDKDHPGIYFLALPMKLNGEIVGVLGLCSRHPNAFDEEARSWLSLVMQILSFGLRERRGCEERLQELDHYKITIDRLMQQILAVDLHAIVSIADSNGVILYANDKFSEVSQYSYEELVGQKHNIVNSGYHPPEFFAVLWKTISSGKVWHGEVCNRRKNGELYWEEATIMPFESPDGKGWHYVSVRTEVTSLKRFEENLLHANEQLEQRVSERTRELERSKEQLEADVEKRRVIESELHKKQAEQEKLILDLKNAQGQLLQSEKMASIGQLAAGVAHEINNPVGYLYSNLGTMQKYLASVFSAFDSYHQLVVDVEKGGDVAGTLSQVKAMEQDMDLEFLKEDIPALMSESSEGIARVKKIVQDLKDFSHVDEAEWQWSDLHKGLDSTLNIVWNELKYKVEIVKEYGTLPDVECMPSQLNQVFMNLLVNAGHAIEERGVITMRTGQQGEEVWIEISDTGKGIAAENLKRIFEPFFTTKPVGKGTGLGLSLSYGIVTNHHGRIEVESTPGVGTKFRVWLPVKQTEKA